MKRHIVFVHGYSVTSLDTYGQLPERLAAEAAFKKFQISISDLYLGSYISFNDDVTLDDLSRAFELACRNQLLTDDLKTFVCITHSTGGPLIRNWLRLYYSKSPETCPMSHLIMLAPPNHGSALAQLGKGRLSRIRSWIDSVEPGQKVLDWLELGSSEAWRLNTDWIRNGARFTANNVFQFVITGQDIDRKFYDHLNSYTGEVGSDGVVRVASANLNSRLIRLQQQAGGDLQIISIETAPSSPLRIVSQVSHSNKNMGIMRSIAAAPGKTRGKETMDALFECLAVENNKDYSNVIKKFSIETEIVQSQSRLETETTLTRSRLHIHDRHCQLIFQLIDSDGKQLTDYDLLLTNETNDPDGLPSGFFTDRQCNTNKSTLTYYLNYDVITGCPEVIAPSGEILRAAIKGIQALGLIIKARPNAGPVLFREARFAASPEFLNAALHANACTMINIQLERSLNSQLFTIEKAAEANRKTDFKKRGK